MLFSNKDDNYFFVERGDFVSEQKDASTIPVSRLNPNFKYEVAGLAGGERIKSCFQCGTCTASCPVRATDESYNPRKIIRMVLLGMRDEVLGSEPIWLCTYCYTCQERCPQDVGITDLMFALKNLAAREGHMHPSYTPQIDVLANFGRMYEVSDFDNKKRAKMGLPALENKKEFIEAVLVANDLKKEAK